MVIQTSHKRIEEAFSKAAESYDAAADLQKQIGRKLIASIEPSDAHCRVLDVGMGTGWFLKEICPQFPHGKFYGLDLAHGMLARAHQNGVKASLIQGDGGKLPFKDGMFDVFVSNLAYQWIPNPIDSFKEIRRALRKWGLVYVTCFGKNTLRELEISLQSSLPKEQRKKFQEHSLVSKKDIEIALQENRFRFPEIFSQKMTLPFNDIFGVLQWIKKIGANAPRRNVFFGTKSLERADDFYKKHFSFNGGIYATFEVIWVRAKK